MENDAILADIILPINTKLEEEPTSAVRQEEVDSIRFLMENQAIDPLGESLRDFQAVGEVAKKLGL